MTGFVHMIPNHGLQTTHFSVEIIDNHTPLWFPWQMQSQKSILFKNNYSFITVNTLLKSNQLYKIIHESNILKATHLKVILNIPTQKLYDLLCMKGFIMLSSFSV